ncbi:MAG: hypothetical protein LBM98_02040 [Oscillospiraceae bacterium]|nr:hypothetical protein [Oscillospiraceae bacterium]
MRSTGKLAIRRALQVRSNPVPGGKLTYLRTAALDCFAAIRPTYRGLTAARKDGARRRDVGRWTWDVGRGTWDVGRDNGRDA